MQKIDISRNYKETVEKNDLKFKNNSSCKYITDISQIKNKSIKYKNKNISIKIIF